MPRKSDWTDYIPASGEASVGLNLKGRYGGKSGGNMRRRFSRSRFRKVPRRQRYWYPNASGAISEQGWSSLALEDTPLNIRSYTNDDPTGLVEPSDLNQQLLLMTQGPIFARLNLIQETPENPTPTQLGNHEHQFFVLAYFWSVDELGGDGSLDLPSKFRFSAPAAPLSLTSRILRRKDILSYGMLPISWENDLQMYGGDTTQVPQYHQTHPHTRLPWTRIPPPRIPKGGIRLGNDRMVNLHTTLLQPVTLGLASLPVWLESEIYAGHFRWLLAK